MRNRTKILVVALLFFVAQQGVIAFLAVKARSTADDVKDQQVALQDSRVEACERLNTRLEKLNAAIHTVFDPSSDTPREMEALRIFDDALKAENCSKALVVSP